MLMTRLHSNSTTRWGDGLRFIQVMKSRAYHERIKCSPYEAMFGQPVKVGLKTSNLSDDAIDDIFAEEELEKIISGQDGDEQNDPTEDPTFEENDLPDITDTEGPVLEFQEETCDEDVPSTEMVTEIPRSPSICAQRKSKTTEKRKIVKSNLQTQAFKMTRLAREKFLQGKVGDTVKVRGPDVDRGKCDSRNILGVVMEADLYRVEADLHRIGTKDGILNSLYARNQFSTFTEGTVNIADVPSVNISLRECAGKHHYLVVKDIEDVIAKRAEVTFNRAESQTSYVTLNVTIVYRAKINDICFDIIMF